jgi:DNA (cytosine-5)-methyltransferase 1
LWRMSDYFPVIDLFAGAGGLGEGFSSFISRSVKQSFQTVLAIEKDPSAHRTLLLRAFFKKFAHGSIPTEYWSYARGEITREVLFKLYPRQTAAAINEIKCIELGEKTHSEVRHLIDRQLVNSRKWVLVGGPPCQAYSIVGRSRMRNSVPDFEKDSRHFLYQEYLKILADHKPPVFVMENVKGLLSATNSGKRMIETILRDLKNPDRSTGNRKNATGYRLFSFVEAKEPDALQPEDFLIHTEKYGIPQARHRLIILGIRDDLGLTPMTLSPSEPPSVKQAIGDLPKLRSGLSKEADSLDRWKQILRSVQDEKWYLKGKDNELLETVRRIDKALDVIKKAELTQGSEAMIYRSKPAIYEEWFRRDCDAMIMNHCARSHMQSDLQRYLFASSYAAVNKRSAQLCDFPKSLLPAHNNVLDGIHNNCFGDRFRVQLADKPSKTITSHISKDGHYFIHHDPAQCRSLTVREAARLQTFPDSYMFEGNRTSQYQQVGNAVPPLLSLKLAEVVHDILNRLKN